MFCVKAKLICVYLFQLGVPLSMDEIPSLPEPEGSILTSQLKQVMYCGTVFFSWEIAYLIMNFISTPPTVINDIIDN